MENKLEKQFLIPASMCDNNSRIGIADIFALFMDLATEHGATLKLSRYDLEQHDLIWLITKTKIRIFDRPQMLDKVTLTTWPAAPGKIQCERFYKITKGDTLLADGKNEWAMLNIKTNKLARIDQVYPNGLIHLEDTACDTPFARVSKNFNDAKELAHYTVRSVDIDGSHHMNNVAYIRAVLGAFSCDEIDKMNVCEADVTYRLQCYEGEALTLKQRDIEKGCEIGIIKADGSTAAVITLKYA